MSVNLFDPQNAINTTSLYNGTPPYQDMFIFAELVASRRGRTVIQTSNDGSSHAVPTGLEKSFVINMLGFNQDKNASSNSMHFTTNYYSGSVPEGQVQYEGFGMTSIKVVISSSYVPQVSIEFIDVRGITFFERNDSPYRILFDFPPPIFNLTIKGFYGNAITYQLHLVKNNTKFDAQSGNFIINSEFVGMTFAPLTDVLLRYLRNFAVMHKGVDNPSSDNNEPPKTTNALYYKFGSLYDNLQKEVNTSTESIAYKNALDQKNLFVNFFNDVNSFNVNSNIPLDKHDTGKMLTYIAQSSNPYDLLTSNFTSPVAIETTTNQYNNVIKSSNANNLTNRLILAFPISGTSTTANMQLATGLNNYAILLRNDVVRLSLYNTNVQIPPAKSLTFQEPQSNINLPPLYKIYFGIDITDLYFQVYQNIAPTNKTLKDTQTALVDKVNALVSSILHISPTVYNIFKIICDDVDYFYKTLRETVVAANTHHQKYKGTILNDPLYNQSDNPTDVFAFPLVIDSKNKRVYPKEISNNCANGTDPFPELILVGQFIDSFLQQKLQEEIKDLRSKTDTNGNNTWIPIGPIDSVYGGEISTNGINSNSPYLGLNNDMNVNSLLNILIRRYYILSQFTFGQGNDFSNKDVIKFYAESEALNIANSVSNTIAINLIKTSVALKFKGNTPSNFYNYIAKTPVLSDLYTLNNSVNNTKILLEDQISVYRNKGNSNFKGVGNITPKSEIPKRNPVNDTVQTFLDSQKSGWFKDIINVIFPSNKSIDPQMTKQNIFTVPDQPVKSDYSSRYIVYLNQPALSNYNGLLTWVTADAVLVNLLKNFDLNKGNSGLVDAGVLSSLKGPENSSSWLVIWSFSFKYYGQKILNLINNAVNDVNSIFLLSLLYLSNYGSTLSPFSLIRNVNTKIFNLPSISEIPYYVATYIGALVEMSKNQDYYNTVVNYFNNGDGKTFIGQGILIFADYHDILNYLSEYDKNVFHQMYIGSSSTPNPNSFMAYYFNRVNNAVLNVLTNNTGQASDYNKDADFSTLLSSSTYAPNIANVLTAPYTIINYSDLTFNTHYSINPTNTIPANTQNYTPLSKLTGNTATNSFFSQFFNNLDSKMGIRNDDIENQKKDFQKSTGDEDIWTQTYYSFKNIADKWISGLGKDIKGYPFNNTSDHLIDKFAFVDRAMNPIGDIMINPKDLVDKLGNDFETNVYTMMSQILSGNNFEFFPLSNFLKFNYNGWRNIFQPSTSNIENESTTSFVCMFIGGTSSYPNGLTNGFVNDGVDDIENDKTLNAPLIIPQKDLDKQLTGNTDFNYNQPLAFNVKFGQNNQSLFYDVQLDSKEFPETNESLQILAKIAGDNKQQAPVPKGQNLYNVYENRSYKAQITMLGDVMIQPTQYFQLDNIPMFSGAYIILGVEHNITPNYMTTTFNGVKISKFPVPFVNTAASIFGIDVGDSDITSGLASVPESITTGFNAFNLNSNNQIPAMSTLTV